MEFILSQLLDYFHNMADVRLVLFTQKNSIKMQESVNLLNKNIICGDFSKFNSFYKKGLYLDRIDVNEFYYINYHTTIGHWFINVVLAGKMREFQYFLDCGLLCFAADPDYMHNSTYSSDYTVISLARNIIDEFITYRIKHIGNYRFAIYGVSKTGKMYFITFAISEVLLKKVNSQLDFDMFCDQPILISQ
jgi:hypothetical protein